jgi:cytoskeletal protein CcmA (bactofilin family)
MELSYILFALMIVVIIYLYIELDKLKKRVLVEGMAGTLSDEAIQNIASIYNNNGELIVPKLKVTGDVNIDGNINVGGNGIIGPAYIGRLTGGNAEFMQVCHKDKYTDGAAPQGYIFHRDGGPSIGIGKGAQFIMADYNTGRWILTASNDTVNITGSTNVSGNSNTAGSANITGNANVTGDLTSGNTNIKGNLTTTGTITPDQHIFIKKCNSLRFGNTSDTGYTSFIAGCAGGQVGHGNWLSVHSYGNAGNYIANRNMTWQ